MSAGPLPAGARARWPVWVALAAIALFLAPFAWSSVYNNDEFTYLSHAKRLALGEVPYRDFFEFLPPLSFWLLSLPVRLFGATIATTHVSAVLVALVASVQLVAIARRLGLAPATAWVPAAVFALGLYPHWGVWSHHWVVLPFELGALALALRGLEDMAFWPWSLAGVCVGLAGMTIQTDGAGLGLALAMGVVLAGWRRHERPGLVVLRLLGLVGGALSVVVFVAAMLEIKGALPDAVYDVIRWPTFGYRAAGGVNDVAFGSDLATHLQPVTAPPAWWIRMFHVVATYALMPAALVAIVAWAVRRARAAWTLADGRRALLALWMVVAFFLATHGNADYVHLSFYAVPAVLWLAVVGDDLGRGRGPAVARWAPMALLVAYALAGALGHLKAMAKEPGLYNQPLAPDRRLVETPVIQYLQGHMRPGDRIAAMPYGGFFYVYGPRPASHYTYILPPSMHYGAPGEFDDIWAEIARRRPRFIVIAPWAFDTWPRAVAAYADHLPPRYHLVGPFGSPQWGGAPAIIYEADEAGR